VRLPLPDASIDAIWGHAILHHLPFYTAMRELRRVLKPHGRLVLSDPFEGGFAVRWARMASGCWNGHQTTDEQPITWHVLNAIKEYFPEVMATFWDIPGVYSGQLSGCWPDNMRWNHSLARYVVISNHALV
jgi:SAM-dependent methyltransferase